MRQLADADLGVGSSRSSVSGTPSSLLWLLAGSPRRRRVRRAERAQRCPSWRSCRSSRRCRPPSPCRARRTWRASACSAASGVGGLEHRDALDAGARRGSQQTGDGRARRGAPARKSWPSARSPRSATKSARGRPSRESIATPLTRRPVAGGERARPRDLARGQRDHAPPSRSSLARDRCGRRTGGRRRRCPGPARGPCRRSRRRRPAPASRERARDRARARSGSTLAASGARARRRSRRRSRVGSSERGLSLVT